MGWIMVGWVNGSLEAVVFRNLSCVADCVSARRACVRRDVGTAICPIALHGLKSWLARREFDTRVTSQLKAFEQLQEELEICDADRCSI